MLLLAISECSMKWDTKQGKDTMTNEVDIVEVDRIIVGPQSNGIVSFHWVTFAVIF